MTTRPFTLATTRSEFDDTHDRVAKTRSTSKTVTVGADAIRHLLRDHSKLLAAAEETTTVKEVQ